MIIALAISVGLVLLLFALIGAPLLFRGTPVDRVVDLDRRTAACTVETPEFPSTVGMTVRCGLAGGNTVELLENGNGIFPRLWEDLRSARRSITVVSYFAKPGVIADTLAAVLAERARAGVPVYWTFDAVGSGTLPEDYFDGLRNAGAHIARFRTLRWYRLDRFNNRTHIRAIVIDGEIGYTGGFGFDDAWEGDGCSDGCWRDSNVRVTGPAVAELQSAFISHWGEAAHELLIDTRLQARTDTARTGDVGTPRPPGIVRLGGVMISPASTGSSNAERMLALTIGTACRNLFITNAYFVPDGDFVNMLCNARGRGVDVRILTNGEKCDVPMTRFAGRRRYERLLRAGVRIFEYQPTVLHSKTFVCDEAWCTVGTVNFDNRSLAFNNEISVLVLDEDFARQLEASFGSDVEHAAEIRLDAFLRRPWHEHLREVVADIGWRWY